MCHFSAPCLLKSEYIQVTSPGPCPAYGSSDFLSKILYPWKRTESLPLLSRSSEFHLFLFLSLSGFILWGKSLPEKKNKKHFYKAWNSGTGIEKRKRRFPLSAFASKLYLWDSHWNLEYSLPSLLCLAWSLCSHWNEKLQATVLNDFRLIEVILTSLKAICSFLRFTSPRCA